MLPEDRTLPAAAINGRRGSVALLAVAALFATQLSATAATSARGSAWTSAALDPGLRSEEHTSELQSLMRISYAVFCLKKKKTTNSRLHISFKQNTQISN